MYTVIQNNTWSIAHSGGAQGCHFIPVLNTPDGNLAQNNSETGHIYPHSLTPMMAIGRWQHDLVHHTCQSNANANDNRYEVRHSKRQLGRVAAHMG